MTAFPPAPPELHGVAAIGPVDGGRARDWQLVLQSQGLPHEVQRAEGGWYLVVDGSELARARAALRLYERATPGWPPRKAREQKIPVEFY